MIASISIIVGLLVLTKSADYFIDGAGSIAHNNKISPLTIGIFVLGFGTSAPEMVVSLFASLGGYPGVAVGNVIGSNIANIALVLGITVLIIPIKMQLRTLKIETTLMVAVSILASILMFWGNLSLMDGVLLFGMLICTLIFLFKLSDKQELSIEQGENSVSNARAIVWVILGMIGLVSSAKLLVWGISIIAQELGISDTIIGLTVVAIGTSLPELAAAINSALKKQTELTIGNIIGSNLFNLLVVLPLPAVLTEFQIPVSMKVVDLPFMLGLAVFLPLVALINKQRMVGRFSGALMLGSYLVYLGYLISITI